MSSAKIKTVDISQIRYTPKEGEIVQHSLDNNFYIYKDDNWMKIDMDKSGINIGLYDINKQIISQLPVLDNLTEKSKMIKDLHMKYKNEYYMLYGKEISYFTLFKIIDSICFGEEVIACLKNVGDIKAIDLTPEENAVEIWVENEDGPTCLFLFPYDNGLVVVE